MMRPATARRQGGFLLVMAVFLLVVLAGLLVYLGLVSRTSQAASAGDLQAARAYQAARAGIEWGAYQVLRNPGGAFRTSCSGGTGTQALSFTSSLADFTATVTCTSAGDFTEGAVTSLRAYTITANGCNSPNAGVCPNASTTSATYVERELRLTLVQ